MTRDAELSAQDWVALVRNGLPSETDIGVLQGVVRQAVSALYLFTPTQYREGALVEFADFLLERARSAASRAVTTSSPCSGPSSASPAADSQLATVEAALRGTEVPEGLTIDADLRWSLVHRLVATGRAAPELIDEEFERDRTASGERQAAAARAAVPDGGGERQCVAGSRRLRRITERLARCDGRWPEHCLTTPSSTDASIDRYFAMLDEIWRTRTNDTAQSLVVGLYPGFLVEQAIIDRTDEYLATHDAPPALRRLLLEGADGVRRSLKAQLSY